MYFVLAERFKIIKYIVEQFDHVWSRATTCNYESPLYRWRNRMTLSGKKRLGIQRSLEWQAIIGLGRFLNSNFLVTMASTTYSSASGFFFITARGLSNVCALPYRMWWPMINMGTPSRIVANKSPTYWRSSGVCRRVSRSPCTSRAAHSGGDPSPSSISFTRIIFGWFFFGSIRYKIKSKRARFNTTTRKQQQQSARGEYKINNKAWLSRNRVVYMINDNIYYSMGAYIFINSGITCIEWINNCTYINQNVIF